MRNRVAVILVALLSIVGTASSQIKSEKFPIFVVGADAAAPVVRSLIRRLNDTQPFEAATANDPSKVIALISCIPRTQTEPFACMYAAQYNGATFKTFLGGGLFVSKSAEEVAGNFLASLAQDIVERFDQAAKDNLRQALQSCLLMTDSKCNVPDPLQKEFNAKQLTLDQWLLKK